MKVSYQVPAFLLAIVTLIPQVTPIPQVKKQAPRVSYAGINIAGCDFGLDLNVKLSFIITARVKVLKGTRVTLQDPTAQPQ